MECVQACPHDAISLSHLGIIIEPQSCTGCGTCIGQCPNGALAREIPLPLREGSTLIIICPRHPAAARSTDPAPRCLHSYGLSEMAGWLLEGIREIACASGDCSTCPEMPDDISLPDTATRLEALAMARNLPVLHLVEARPAHLRLWSRQASDAPAPQRRALLRALSAPLRPEEEADPEPALARLQAHEGSLFAFAPEIDPQYCTGCDACIRICPDGALTRIKDNSGDQYYHTNPVNCSGCRICEDVCSDDAIRVEAMSTVCADLPLTAMRCRACGVEMHLPAAAAVRGGGLCPVCTRTGHHKKLFQVLP